MRKSILTRFIELKSGLVSHWPNFLEMNRVLELSAVPFFSVKWQDGSKSYAILGKRDAEAALLMRDMEKILFDEKLFQKPIWKAWRSSRALQELMPMLTAAMAVADLLMCARYLTLCVSHSDPQGIIDEHALVGDLIYLLEREDPQIKDDMVRSAQERSLARLKEYWLKL